ncbi:MAG TPA: hypothetical protein VFW07_17680 [Parafilimonas sp.]|nr:hypothetical protein [Parafilimonas sp.]
MSDIYFLKNDQSSIDFEVQVGTIGNVGTVAKKFRAGNSGVQIVGTSSSSNGGDIETTNLGISLDLIGSVLVVTTGIILGKKDDLNQAFENLFMAVTLTGGLDGKQVYKINDTEKSKFEDTRSIVAAKAIKLQGH